MPSDHHLTRIFFILQYVSLYCYSWRVVFMMSYDSGQFVESPILNCSRQTTMPSDLPNERLRLLNIPIRLLRAFLFQCTVLLRAFLFQLYFFYSLLDVLKEMSTCKYQK